MFTIRNAEISDLTQICGVYGIARKYMSGNGNPSQWGNVYPPIELLQKDIYEKRLFVLEQDDCICGVFVFFIGEDKTYSVIRNGKWLSDSPYGVIHRVASNGKERGVLNAVVEFCESRIKHLRVDTHMNNAKMRHAIEKSGFTECGIITVADGTPRIAYEKRALS